MDKIYFNKTLKSKAQELRRESTWHENQLWYQFLRDYPVQFRRQKQFARYIVDFYCSKAKLIIELDGTQHHENQAVLHDRARTVYLESLGLYVLRFDNREIEARFDLVCRIIDQCVKERIASFKKG